MSPAGDFLGQVVAFYKAPRDLGLSYRAMTMGMLFKGRLEYLIENLSLFAKLDLDSYRGAFYSIKQILKKEKL